MSIRNRLLGFAFASSDLLLELDARGTVVFGLGSGPSNTLSAESFCGVALWNRVAVENVATLNGVLKGLREGARSAPLELRFSAGEDRMRRATARFFLLPDLAPNISCSVTWEGPAYGVQGLNTPPALTPADFLARAREVLEPPADPRDLAVAFVNVQGLAAAQDMGQAGERLNARIEAALQAASIDGASAGRLGPERFAMLRDRSVETDIEGEVHELGYSEGVDLSVQTSETALVGDDSPINALRALRFAVEGCLKEGDTLQPDLAFKAALARTIKDAHAFRAIVRDRRFALHYQPIVDLKSGAVNHFEALSRFKGTDGPAPLIRMAEELGLIEGFDIAVAEMALVRLRQPGSGLLKFAVNVSGASLADDHYVQTLLKMTVSRPDERRRLLVEVTETAALADIEAANRRLGALRSAGIKVCIDDFGAGSASYDYLHGLSVDTVKIDGKFVEKLETDPRARTLVSHLVDLCRSMKVDTIAEMIETQGVADILQGLGVDQGQGWLFGKAEAEPRTALAGTASAARRIGAVAGWG